MTNRAEITLATTGTLGHEHGITVVQREGDPITRPGNGQVDVDASCNFGEQLVGYGYRATNATTRLVGVGPIRKIGTAIFPMAGGALAQPAGVQMRMNIVTGGGTVAAYAVCVPWRV